MGVPVAYVSEGVSSEAQGAFWQAVTVLERLGMQRVDLELPAAQYAAVTSSAISLAEVGSIHHRWFLSRPDDYGEDARAVLSVALCLSADDYLKAQRARRVIVNETVMALRQVDVLVTPTIGSGAPPIAKGNAGLGDRPYEVGRHYHVLNRLLSLAGLPAITLPCGFTATGLPLGIQVAGKALDELTVLRVAHAYEAHTSWRNRRPPLDR
jgi:aspartyl-tRNA(Asn)/glutamyl-tRNA(Gln) amidotransferase subunit A